MLFHREKLYGICYAKFNIYYVILKYVGYRGSLLFCGRGKLLAFCERARKLIDFWYTLDCASTPWCHPINILSLLLAQLEISKMSENRFEMRVKTNNHGTIQSVYP